jgi:hypothetical protein
MSLACHASTRTKLRTLFAAVMSIWLALIATAPPALRHVHDLSVGHGHGTSHHHGHAHHQHHSAQHDDTAPVAHWHFWLIGLEWILPAGGDPAQPPVDDSDAVVVASALSDAVIAAASDVARPVADTSLFGSSAPADVGTLAPPWRCSSRAGPILCDAARRLRTGVQLI